MASKTTSKPETITSKKAQLYLESNTNNRKVRQKTVDFYAKQMKEGKWKNNGKSLVFSTDGTLLDGQHRLEACVQSGASFRTFVVRGADDDAFSTIDTGIGRTSGDIVGRAGYGNANRKAAAMRIILAMLEVDGHIEGPKPNLGVKRPHQEILDGVIEHDALLEEACLATRADDGPRLMKPPAAFCALYVVLAMKNRRKAIEFFGQLTSGANLERDDPAAKLRKTLIGALSLKNVRRKKTYLLAITIKGWNAFLQGRTVGNFKFSESEKFPKIRARG